MYPKIDFNEEVIERLSKEYSYRRLQEYPTIKQAYSDGFKDAIDLLLLSSREAQKEEMAKSNPLNHLQNLKLFS